MVGQASSRFSNVAVAVAVALVLVAGWTSHTALQRAAVQIRMLSSANARLASSDRLIGVDVAGLLSGDAAGGSGAETVIWIVDPVRCLGCLARPVEWSLLQESEGLRTLLILRGMSQDGAVETARKAGITGHTRGDLDDAAEAVLGPLLPNTRLFANASGTVVFADTRHPDQSCGWNLVQQVALLRGLNAGRPATQASLTSDAQGLPRPGGHGPESEPQGAITLLSSGR